MKYVVSFSLILVLLIAGCSPADQSESEATKNCGNDFNCFVEASQSCNEAKVNHAITTNIFGVIQETNNDYRLEKGQNGCVLHLVSNEINVQYSDELLLTMRESGVSQVQINEQLQMVREQYDGFAGKEGFCIGKTQVIHSLLGRWRDGFFSATDWDSLECDGTYFDQLDTEFGLGEIESSVETDENSTSFRINIGDDTERECLFSKDCQEGFHCMNRECVSNDIVDGLSDCQNNECSGSCDNCKKKSYSCMKSSESFKDNKCVECFMDLQCESGYECRDYRCVEESI